jgi:1-acyl-sn-glycerol-3-phosphate acyltransferase
VRRLLQRLALYSFHILFARPVLRWVVGVRYRRRDLPDGPCLVVSNHNSHLDAAVLMTMFPLRRLAHVHPVAAADYFGSNWFMNMMAMLFMNGIPIERRPGRGEDPLDPLVDLIESGKTLIFFPEGSRGEAGVVAKFRAGVGKLVQGLPGLLVVPVFISGPERIWPRGEIVPVPLSIDANVGRPRSYASDEEPRAIAQRVRDDVLALAPPRPPVPGARPEPPLRVAVCGVDDAGVGTLARMVTERLGGYGATLGVANPVLEADGDGAREATGPVPVGRDRAWLGLLATLFHTGPRFRGRRFVELVERAQLNEVLSQGRETRFVVERGSVLVDLLASGLVGLDSVGNEKQARDLLIYLTGEKKIPLGRAWALIRGARETWLINTFNLTRTTVPEVLVHLTRPVPDLLSRLRSAGDELLPFHTEPGLECLQQAYRAAAELLRRRHRVRVLELDLSAMNAETAADRIEAACLGFERASAEATPVS